MKKTFVTLSLFAGLCAISFTSCNKIKEKLFPAFDTEIGSVDVVIPITLAGAQASNSSTVSFNLDSTIKAYTANTFSIKNLSSVKVKDIGVMLMNPDDLNDISNFENVSVAFSSNTNTTPVVVASTTISNTPASVLNITPADSPELKGYLTGNQLKYTVAGKARRSTTKALNAMVSVTLSIK